MTCAGRSLTAYSIPGAAGKRAKYSGLPSHSPLTGLLESQHKPPYPLLWSKLLSDIFSYPSKGLKRGSFVAYFSLCQICVIFACLLIGLQICKQCCVCHSDSNLRISTERSLEDVISVREVHLPTSVDSAQGYCTTGCAICYSKKKPLLMRTSESKDSS